MKSLPGYVILQIFGFFFQDVENFDANTCTTSMLRYCWISETLLNGRNEGNSIGMTFFSYELNEQCRSCPLVSTEDSAFILQAIR
jgi:hypothetical protein